jgi:hypothetical protein
MCDRLSKDFGYICDECFSELQETQPRNKMDVLAFIQSTKDGEIYNASLDLDKIFPIQEYGRN